jgi:predicted ATPase
VLCSAATARAATASAATASAATARAATGRARTARTATARAVDGGAGEFSLDDLGLHRLRGFDGRERLFQLVSAGLDRLFPRPRGAAAAAHNLPVPLTGFIGRSTEQRDLRALLAHNRLVSVVGPGGAGKTRIAVEVAAAQVARHPDGVWFADFAGVADADLLEVCLANALGLRPEPGRALADTLVDHVAARRLLLVLDTCDAYPIGVAALVERLLAGGAGVTVLATSREPLRLPGEVVWRIPPLSLLPAGPRQYSDAVALLVDRAEAARGGRPVAPEEVADLARVAAAMDGLPLALELAAARLRVLSAAQLAARLNDVTAVTDAGTRHPHAADPAGTGGAPPRHRTMDATVEWSYRTLSPDAARLLRWLSVFAGPVDLSIVETVLGADPLDAVTTLVDKSLLQADGAAYRMLDPIRSYAARRLRAAGEERTARNRHVAWCRLATRQANLDADGHPVTLSLHALDPLADEVRAALRWTATFGSVRAGLFLARALDQWWRERGLAREGRRWLTRLYSRLANAPADDSVPDAELAAAYHLHSLLAGADGEFAEELAYSRRAEQAAYRADDPALIARVLSSRGAPLLEVGRVEDAEQVCRETIEWATRAGVGGDALFAVYCLAELLWQRRDLDEAAILLASARPLEAARPAERGRRTVDMLLGLVALVRGDLVAAHDHLVVALRSRVANGFHSRAGETLCAMAVRCALGGDPLMAARLFGAAQAARSRLRVSAGVFATYWAEHEASVRAGLGDVEFDSAYAEGSAWSVERAAAMALAVEHPDLVAGSRRFTPA